jgi:hypothetical protein
MQSSGFSLLPFLPFLVFVALAAASIWLVVWLIRMSRGRRS